MVAGSFVVHEIVADVSVIFAACIFEITGAAVSALEGGGVGEGVGLGGGVAPLGGGVPVVGVAGVAGVAGAAAVPALPLVEGMAGVAGVAGIAPEGVEVATANGVVVPVIASVVVASFF